MDSFFGIGPFELVFIVIFALIFLGPERLPGVLREGIKLLRKAREVTNEVTSMVNDEFGDLTKDIRELDPRYQMQQALKPQPKPKKPKEDETKPATAKADAATADPPKEQISPASAAALAAKAKADAPSPDGTGEEAAPEATGAADASAAPAMQEAEAKPDKPAANNREAMFAAWTGKPPITRQPNPNAVARNSEEQRSQDKQPLAALEQDRPEREKRAAPAPANGTRKQNGAEEQGASQPEAQVEEQEKGS
jgi:sec-independent protein translocase protein TatB